MSKNMKLDARVRFKHQTLVQDYMELQQETETARNNLMVLKQKKLTLQAEVRFLRRRHKLLLEKKSLTLQEQVLANPQPTQFRKSNKEKVQMEKIKTLPKLPPTGKKKAPGFDMVVEDSLQQSVQRVVANQRVRINGPKEYQFLDLSRKDDILESQHLGQTQQSVIDLNRISREEEKLHGQCDPFDPRMQGLTRNGVDSPQDTDAQLSMFINGGKRKVSWEEPVAVRVWS